MNLTTLVISLIAGFLSAAGAGALSGVIIGGKDLGAALAAVMGGIWGCLSGLIALVFGLLIVWVAGGF